MPTLSVLPMLTPVLRPALMGSKTVTAASKPNASTARVVRHELPLPLLTTRSLQVD